MGIEVLIILEVILILCGFCLSWLACGYIGWFMFIELKDQYGYGFDWSLHKNYFAPYFSLGPLIIVFAVFCYFGHRMGKGIEALFNFAEKWDAIWYKKRHEKYLSKISQPKQWDQ